jgi:Ca2+-binding RTX toxin-like protein
MDIRWRGILVAAACVLGLGAFAPVAGAATAQVDGGVLRFQAASGETNTIRIARPDANTYTVTDVGIPTPTAISPGLGCSALTAWSVSCVAAGLTSIEVLLGDLNDELNVVSADLPLTAQGEDGDDTFDDAEAVTVGLTPARSFSGGAGNDYMRASVLTRSAADGGPIAHDYLGGPGSDFVDYNYRGPTEGGIAQPHTVTLDDVANDGIAAEGDNVHADIERVVGSEGADTFTGTSGDDYFLTRQGADTVNATAGNDRLYADGCEADVLNGGEGNDSIHLGGNTTADGGNGDDRILSEDVLCIPGGSDTVNGGAGVDEASFTAVPQPVTVSLDDVANDGLGGADNFHSDVENLTSALGTAGVTFIGNNQANGLAGGSGNDVLVGGGGADRMQGGAGVDLADYSARTAAVSLSPDEAANDGETGEGDQIWSDIENLRGGAANDTLTGSALDNVLDGGPGSDSMTGGAGVDAVDYSTRSAAVTVNLATGTGGAAGESDTIGADVEGAFGGSGGDTLTGNAGAGFLSGLAGADKLVDGGGVDTLDAGAGDDEINSVDGAADQDVCGAGTDKVTSDSLDSVAADCEPAGGPAPPAGPPAQPTPSNPGGSTNPKPPVAPIDTTVPSASVEVGKRQRLRGVRSGGLRLTVRVGEASTVAATLTAESTTRAALKRRRIPVKAVLASGRTDVAQAGRKALTLRPTRHGRRALRGLAVARLKLVVIVTDRAGNRRTVTTHLRVKA